MKTLAPGIWGETVLRVLRSTDGAMTPQAISHIASIGVFQTRVELEKLRTMKLSDSDGERWWATTQRPGT